MPDLCELIRNRPAWVPYDAYLVIPELNADGYAAGCAGGRGRGPVLDEIVFDSPKLSVAY